MAKNEPAPVFDETEYCRVIEEANRQGKLVAEYNGNLGAVVKNAAERLGVDRQTIAFVRRLANMDPAKRDARIIDLLRGMNAMRFLDGLSVLDGEGVRDWLLRIADDVEAREPETTIDARRAAEDMEKVLH